MEGSRGKAQGMLGPYKVLDLTDEKGFLCGKLLGDLGADVIKIEPPGGDPSRNIGPFYHDEPDPEKSLFWFSFNTSKRGITLDINTAEGQDVFKKLVKGADFVIESFSPGYMDGCGLGYKELRRINPGVIMVSITPFGQTGPYKEYKTSDITAWAMAGVTKVYGDADRPPTFIGHHFQAYLHAAAEAAGGAMAALYRRGITGQGQHVDAAIHESAVRGANLLIGVWQAYRSNRGRGEMFRTKGLPSMWRCMDGHAIFLYWSGPMSARINRAFINWMDSEGRADEFIKKIDWEKIELEKADREFIDRITRVTQEFFLNHTKAELMEGAIKHRLQLYPVSTTHDLLKSEQLEARSFWVKLEHPELGESITYPGPFAKSSETPPAVWRRAPLVGEHNQEVYTKELGLSDKEISGLEKSGII